MLALFVSTVAFSQMVETRVPTQGWKSSIWAVWEVRKEKCEARASATEQAQGHVGYHSKSLLSVALPLHSLPPLSLSFLLPIEYDSMTLSTLIVQPSLLNITIAFFVIWNWNCLSITHSRFPTSPESCSSALLEFMSLIAFLHHLCVSHQLPGTGFVHLAQCAQCSVYPVVCTSHWFFVETAQVFCAYGAHWFVHLLMCVWVASAFLILWMIVPWTWMCVHCCIM